MSAQGDFALFDDICRRIHPKFNSAHGLNATAAGRGASDSGRTCKSSMCALHVHQSSNRGVRTRFRDYGYFTEMGRTLNGAVPATQHEPLFPNSVLSRSSECTGKLCLIRPATASRRHSRCSRRPESSRFDCWHPSAHSIISAHPWHRPDIIAALIWREGNTDSIRRIWQE
jgi:hypothetical protein